MRGPPGNLHPGLDAKDHSLFERQGTILSSKAPITFATATLAARSSRSPARPPASRSSSTIPEGTPSGTPPSAGAGIPDLHGTGKATSLSNSR